MQYRGIIEIPKIIAPLIIGAYEGNLIAIERVTNVKINYTYSKITKMKSIRISGEKEIVQWVMDKIELNCRQFVRI